MAEGDGFNETGDGSLGKHSIRKLPATIHGETVAAAMMLMQKEGGRLIIAQWILILTTQSCIMIQK